MCKTKLNAECKRRNIYGYSTLKTPLDYINALQIQDRIEDLKIYTLPEWYKIPEILPAKFLQIIKTVYDCDSKEKKSQTNNQLTTDFLKHIRGLSDKEIQERYENAHEMRILSMISGSIHQRFMGAFSGIIDLKTGKGCDITDEADTFIAEIKSAENTTNSDSGSKVTEKLKEFQKLGKTAIRVNINSNIHLDKKDNIWYMSGKAFYAWLSKRQNFMDDLYATIRECFKRYKTFDELLTSLETL